MKVFLCRWQNGDFSIVGARNSEEAIKILDELADATDAELFETKSLLIDLHLNDEGRFDFNGFGEDLEDAVWENCYPLLLKASHESEEDEPDLSEAVKAERTRLWPDRELRPTESLARNLFVARIASDQNISLAAALKKIRAKKLTFDEPWHTLAARCATLNAIQFDTHISSMLDSTEQSPDPSLRMSSVPAEELKPYDKADLLPHFLLAAVIAAHTRGSILMVWPLVRKEVKEEIGTFWYWLAQAVRALPITA